MIRWPWRSNRQHSKVLGEFDVEETSYIIPYVFKESRMKLIVHLPSMRVSERHYDEFGNLIKYYHNTTMSTEHISNICKQDPSLQKYINVAKVKATLNSKRYKRREMYCSVLRLASYVLIYISLVVLASILFSQCNGGVG